MNKIFVAKFSWNKDWEPAQINFYTSHFALGGHHHACWSLAFASSNRDPMYRIHVLKSMGHGPWCVVVVVRLRRVFLLSCGLRRLGTLSKLCSPIILCGLHTIPLPCPYLFRLSPLHRTRHFPPHGFARFLGCLNVLLGLRLFWLLPCF